MAYARLMFAKNAMAIMEPKGYYIFFEGQLMKKKFVKVAEKAGNEVLKYLIVGFIGVTWHRLSTWLFIRPQNK